MNNIFLVKENVYLLSYIGSIFNLNFFSDFTLMILKNNKKNCVLLYNEIDFFRYKNCTSTKLCSVSYIPFRKWRIRNSKFTFNYRFHFNEKNTINNGFLLSFMEYNQWEWRFIRFILSDLGYIPTVLHKNFFYPIMRTLTFSQSIEDMKKGQLLMIHSIYNNISLYSNYINLINLFTFLSASRTFENIWFSSDSVDFVSLLSNEVDNIVTHDNINTTESSIYLEEQFTLSGLYVNNYLFSPEYIPFLYSHSFLNYYKNIYKLFSLSITYLVNIFFILFITYNYLFMSFFIMYSFMPIKWYNNLFL